MDWREKWEVAAGDEQSEYDSISLEQLIERIENGWFGNYYALWRTVEARATLELVGWLLFDVLESKASYLHRYHCARALLNLMGETRFDPVHLSGNNPKLQQNLLVIEKELIKRLGPRVEQ